MPVNFEAEQMQNVIFTNKSSCKVRTQRRKSSQPVTSTSGSFVLPYAPFKIHTLKFYFNFLMKECDLSAFVSLHSSKIKFCIVFTNSLKLSVWILQDDQRQRELEDDFTTRPTVLKAASSSHGVGRTPVSFTAPICPPLFIDITRCCH